MEQRTTRIIPPMTPPADLVTLLREQAARHGDREAVVFCEAASSTPCSYAELDRRARRIAAALQQRVGPGERALLLYPPGLEYLASFFGCLYAGVVAVPAYPPDPARLERTLPRLLAIIADAQATVALSTSWIAGLAQEVAEIAPELGALEWLGTDGLADGGEAAWRDPAVGPDQLAFLQYTSGSTRAPRGVMLTHGNLLHNSAAIARAFGCTADSVVVTWLPPYHDMGLIGGLLQPLYVGFPCVWMDPMAFLRRPAAWLEAITRYRATLSGGPNFAYDLCVRRIPPAERAGLDLSSWELAFNGAEPVRAQTLERFAEAFGPYGFRPEAAYPCYGLAEATLFVAGGRRGALPIVSELAPAHLAAHAVRPAAPGDPDAVRLVSAGLSTGVDELLIVDPATRSPSAPGQVGEIWLRGAGVAQGYWGRPEESGATFGAALAAGGAGPYLRTGDLGFRQDGQLYITGRLKDLIIIGGKNHYPQDLELTVEQSHPALRPGCAAAFAIERDGEEQLAVAVEVERAALGPGGLLAGADAEEAIAGIARAARQAVAAAHSLSLATLALVRPGALPKTSSGKIQRGACREALLAGTLELVGVSAAASGAEPGAIAGPWPGWEALREAPPAEGRARLEGWLCALVAETLRLPPERIDAQAPLSSYGIDSRGAIELAAAIEAGAGVAVPSLHVLRGDSVAQLADLLLAERASAPRATAASGPRERFPLAYGQRAIWFLQQLAPASPAYTLTNAVRVVGALDEAALGLALARLTERHPALRTIFPNEGDGPVQRVLPAVAPPLAVEDASALDEAALARRLEQLVFTPLDLERGPLFRVLLLRRAPEEALVVLSVHHIVSDFWSLALLFYELKALYDAACAGQAAALPPSTEPYASYVDWELATVGGERGEEHWRYWERQLAGELPALDLATDGPRPLAQTFRGATRATRAGPELTRGLQALARAHGATTFMAVLAAFCALLHRYSGQEEVIVGVPRAARRAAWMRSMGFFVNTLPIRAEPGGAASFSELLAQVRETALAAFAHADYPFALIVERLQPRRDPSRSPVFQAMLAWQKTVRLRDTDALTPFALNQEGGVLPFGAARLESIALPHRVVPFDLTLMAGELGDELFFSFEYNSDLFSAATVELMLGHLTALLEAVVADPARPIAELGLLSAGERARLAGGLAAAEAAPAPAACVHELVAAQAARAPAAPALVWWAAGGATRQLSYGELDRRAELLAHHLRAIGVGPEVAVGVCLDRSPELIIALLGVLKAGGVFVPLDPAYPRERLRYMLADAGALVLLSQARLVDLFDDAGVEGGWPDTRRVLIDADWPAIVAGAGGPLSRTDLAAAAYVIYTSGSTGEPKGVVIEHQAFAAHCLTMIAHYALTAADRVLQFASLNFDAALEQILPPLMSGATLYLRPAELWTAEACLREAAAHGLTVINVPPAYWQQLAAAAARGAAADHRLRLVIVGGDQIAPESIAHWRASPLARARLLNAYGPTETTITATTHVVDPAGAGRIPIGRPLPGRTAYVLDGRGELAPSGVPGELYLGGAGLARGYLGRPALTAEQFVPDPFAGRPGARLYRTGDLVRLRPDGALEFLGRIDEQLKIRGFRIEPGEIAGLLRRHPAVEDALVVAQAGPGGDRRLVAYLVPRGVGAAIPAPGELRAHLRASLPEFMLPAAFVAVERWPLTAGGKIDRRALPAPAAAGPDADDGAVAPRNAVEAMVAGVWADLLGLPQVGVHDSFFELGGHSLLATRLIGAVRELFQVELPLRALFADPTVAGMAAALVAELAADEGGRLDALLDELEGLPDGAIELEAGHD